MAVDDSKKFYWIKLQKDFFHSKRIKKMRKLAGGDTLLVIYLKMQLLSLEDDGYLYYTGLYPTFAEELAEDLDEEVSHVQMLLSFLTEFQLAEYDESNNCLYLPWVKLNTGSETKAAQRKRKYREGLKQVGGHCPTEIEKEIEKEIEIEIDKGDIKKPKITEFSTSYAQSFAQPNDFEQKRAAALEQLSAHMKG